MVNNLNARLDALEQRTGQPARAGNALFIVSDEVLASDEARAKLMKEAGVSCGVFLPEKDSDGG